MTGPGTSNVRVRGPKIDELAPTSDMKLPPKAHERRVERLKELDASVYDGSREGELYEAKQIVSAVLTPGYGYKPEDRKIAEKLLARLRKIEDERRGIALPLCSAAPIFLIGPAFAFLTLALIAVAVAWHLLRKKRTSMRWAALDGVGIAVMVLLAIFLIGQVQIAP